MNTIESLEDDFWGNAPDDSTDLIMEIYSLRRKNIEDFSIENLRLLIGQNIALDILIPKTINVLYENVLAEGDYYEGDLLKAVVGCDADYWLKHPTEKNNMVSLIKNRLSDLQEVLSSNVLKQVEEFIR